MKLENANQRVEYKIIGEGPLRDNLERLIQDLKAGETVKLLGGRDEQEIHAILDHSDIFMAASVTAKDGNQDGQINVLKEAMAVGLPVVSTQHGGIPELVQDGVSGFLVPERDTDALAEKLSFLIQHQELWPQMGRAGRATVEKNYDSDKLNDELVEIYTRLLV